MHHEILVDLEQLAANVKYLQQAMLPAKLCAVLKNDAYGHGLLRCAQVISDAGVKDFGVVDNHEIKKLRTAGDPALAQANLWRIRPALPWEREEALTEGWRVIEQLGSLDDLDWALSVADQVAVSGSGNLQTRIQTQAKAKFVIALDCSIGREGFGVPSHTKELIYAVDALGPERIAGVMTHLANADGGASALRHTEKELDDFDVAIEQIQSIIGRPCITHVGNSAAGLRLARVRNHYSMIRCGAGLFGETTSQLVENPKQLRACFGWRTWVAQVRCVPQGARIGYGSTYLATQDELVATLPIGYADGFKKSLSNGAGEVLVRGVRCPVRGAVSSSITVIGVSHVPGPALKPGEEVVLIGGQAGEYQGPDEFASRAGTGHLDIQAGIRAPIAYG